MKVVRYELIPERELLQLLKQTRLRGHGQPQVYADASLELIRRVAPDTLVPAQRYVLEEDFRRIEALHREFLSRSVDIFALEGGLLFWGPSSSRVIPLSFPACCFQSSARVHASFRYVAVFSFPCMAST